MSNPSAPEIADHKLLNVKDAARIAGVSATLVYLWCEERRLAHFRVGAQGKRGKILIHPRDLEDFMESIKVQPGELPTSARFTHER